MVLETIYIAKSRFNYGIDDLFFLGRNLDKLRTYLEDDEWTTERKGDTVTSYNKGEKYSETTYVEDRPPEYFRAMVKISGIEEYPFDTRVTLTREDENKTLIEYKVLVDFGPEVERDVMIFTMDEIRKALFEQFVSAVAKLERERGSEHDAPVTFEDLEVFMGSKM
jgi:hypothetical protein